MKENTNERKTDDVIKKSAHAYKKVFIMKSQNTYFSSKSRSWRLSDPQTDSSHWSEWVSGHISVWKGAFVAGQKHNTSRSEPLFMSTVLHFHRVGGIRAAAVTKQHCSCCPRPSHSDVWSRSAPVGHIFRDKRPLFYWETMLMFLFCPFLVWVDWQVSIEARLKEFPVLTKPASQQVNVRTPLTMVFVPPREVSEWPRESWGIISHHFITLSRHFRALQSSEPQPLSILDFLFQ